MFITPHAQGNDVTFLLRRRTALQLARSACNTLQSHRICAPAPIGSTAEVLRRMQYNICQSAACRGSLLNSVRGRGARSPIGRHRGRATSNMAAAGASPEGRIIQSLSTIAPQYQAILLDQFGVLHDGRQPYPAAIDAVAQLHTAGKQIIILSNSSRRSSGTIGKLAKMGFQADCFAGAVTSGEMTHQYLLTRPTPWWQQLGRHCLHLTWGSRGAISLEGLDLQVVSEPEEADFILAHGTEAVGQPDGTVKPHTLPELEQLLQRSAALGGRPMVVANPDLVTVNGPSLVVMPGTLAKHYSEHGGHVQLMGKPDPVIYQAAQAMLPDVPLSGWLAVGDSVEHDIQGASAAGMDSCFIVSGIHAKELSYQAGPPDGSNPAFSNTNTRPCELDRDADSAPPQSSERARAGDGTSGATAGGTWLEDQLQQLLKHHQQSPTYIAGAMVW